MDDEWQSNDPRENQDVLDSDQIALAFARHRDRFPEMTDNEYEESVLRPLARGLQTFFLREFIESMPADLREQVLAFAFRDSRQSD